MTWIFHVSAKDERKLCSRLLLVLEQQMIAIEIFHAEFREGRAQVTFVISSEPDRACRIQSLVCRLQDVISVSVRCG